MRSTTSKSQTEPKSNRFPAEPATFFVSFFSVLFAKSQPHSWSIVGTKCINLSISQGHLEYARQSHGITQLAKLNVTTIQSVELAVDVPGVYLFVLGTYLVFFFFLSRENKVLEKIAEKSRSHSWCFVCLFGKNRSYQVNSWQKKTSSWKNRKIKTRAKQE